MLTRYYYLQDSKAAYEKYQSLSKFTIASKPVSVSFIHSGVFVPIYNTNAPDVDKYTFLADNGLRLAYWDEEGYVSEMVISKEEVSVQEIDKKAEPSKKKGEKPEAKPTKKRKAETGIQDSTSGAPAGTSVKKAIPSHLQFWQDRHMELHGVVPVASASGGSQDGDDDDSKLTASSKRKKIHGSTTATASNAKGASADASVDEGPPKDSFADLSRNACLLCARQFKSAQEVHKHERLSALHRTNIQDEKLVATAREKLAKARTKTAADNGPVYRDRAKERRAVFGQPRKPDHKNSSKSAASEAKDATAPSAVLPAPPVQVQSKGAALLSKMGWSSGEGLGAQGDGIVAPVIAEMYAEGVGLGAAGGKVGEAAEVAGQNTGGGYKDFMKRAKEKAKQRYEEMQ